MLVLCPLVRGCTAFAGGVSQYSVLCLNSRACEAVVLSRSDVQLPVFTEAIVPRGECL